MSFFSCLSVSLYPDFYVLYNTFADSLSDDTYPPIDLFILGLFQNFNYKARGGLQLSMRTTHVSVITPPGGPVSDPDGPQGGRGPRRAGDPPACMAVRLGPCPRRSR